MLSGVNLKTEHSNHERLGFKHDNPDNSPCGFSTELSFLDPLLSWYTQVLVLWSIRTWDMGRNIKILFFFIFCFFRVVGSFFLSIGFCYFEVSYRFILLFSEHYESLYAVHGTEKMSWSILNLLIHVCCNSSTLRICKNKSVSPAIRVVILFYTATVLTNGMMLLWA